MLTIIGVVPGGIAEIFEPTNDFTEAIILKCRKGFIKLALETGSDVLPSYAFGQTQVVR